MPGSAKIHSPRVGLYKHLKIHIVCKKKIQQNKAELISFYLVHRHQLRLVTYTDCFGIRRRFIFILSVFRNGGGRAAGLWGVCDSGLLAEGAVVTAVPPVHRVIQQWGQWRREQLLFSFLCSLLHWAIAAPGTQRKSSCTSRILVNSPQHKALHFIYWEASSVLESTLQSCALPGEAQGDSSENSAASAFPMTAETFCFGGQLAVH